MDNINDINAVKALVDKYGAQKVVSYYVSKASAAAASCGSAATNNNVAAMALRLGEIQTSLSAIKSVVNEKENINDIDKFGK